MNTNNKLKFSQTFIYGLPGLPLAMLGLPLFVYLPSYYNQNLGLSLTAVGFVLLLARSLDVITDPIIGLLNDRYPHLRSSEWRRKSYIIIGIPLLLIGLNFLLRPTQGVTAFYLFTWSFITYLGWTLVNIPWLALGAEVSHDYNEKSALASSREVFAVIGTVTVISLPVILGIQNNLEQTLKLTATLLTLLIPISLLPLLWKLVVLKSTNKDFDSNVSNSNSITDKSELEAVKDKKSKRFSRELLKIIKLPAIKRLLPAYFVNSVANAFPATLFILFVSYVIQTPEQVGILLIAYFLSAIIGIPLWLYIASRTDKHISWCIALAGAVVSFMCVPLLGAGDFNAFLIICLTSGFFLGADVVMPASIQADISQHISKSNEGEKESTALLFGLWGLLTKLSLALAIGIAFPILDLMGLNAASLSAKASANDNAELSLIVLYAVIPILLKCWVLFQMWQFPFDKYFFSDLSSQKSNTKKGSNNENFKTETLHHSDTFISSSKRV